MPDYSRSQRADWDIEHFYDEGLERFGLKQADKFLGELEATFTMLANNQGCGTRYRLQGNTYRRWIKGPYAIFYSTEGENIRILRLFDTRSNYERDLKLASLTDEAPLN